MNYSVFQKEEICVFYIVSLVDYGEGRLRVLS